MIAGVAGYWHLERRRRKQRVLLIQEDRTIIEKILPVEMRYMGKKKPGELAWLMIHKLLYPFKGKLAAVVTERDAFPMDPFGALSDEEINSLGDVQTIAREHYKDNVSKIIANEANRVMLYTIGLMVAVIAIVFLIVATLAVLGKVDFNEIFANLSRIWS